MAIEALTRFTTLQSGNSHDEFHVAAAHWQLRNKLTAHSWFDKAVEWIEKRQPFDEELVCFRTEAEALLGLELKRD